MLVFDEIVTGFRFAYGGAQELYGVTPDVCTLGKIIGGGFPLAAIAGKADIMAHFDKTKVGAEGFLMQLGTLSGNPVAAVAGMKTMEVLRRPGQYDKLRNLGKTLMTAISDHLGKAGFAKLRHVSPGRIAANANNPNTKAFHVDTSISITLVADDAERKSNLAAG